MASDSSPTPSLDTSSDYPDDPTADLTNDQLTDAILEIERNIDVLESETQMFDKFYNRLDRRDIQPTAAAVSFSSSHDLAVPRGRKRSKSRSTSSDRALKLTPEQKCDIAIRELEEAKAAHDKVKEKYERGLDTLKAEIMESEVRVQETKKLFYEFERDIVRGAVDRQSGLVIAEKVVKHFEDRLRAKETLIEKLRLKNANSHALKRKLSQQLRQKEEMGEVLHEVDFNQLKIENQQYIEKIEERNKDLLRLKLMAGSTQQVLNVHKKKLNLLVAESRRLTSEISSRTDMMQRIGSETVQVEKDREAAWQINQRLRQQMADYEVPPVMQYVSDKAELYDLTKTLRSWQRKVEIAEMALKTHQKTWNRLQQQSRQLVS